MWLWPSANERRWCVAGGRGGGGNTGLAEEEVTVKSRASSAATPRWLQAALVPSSSSFWGSSWGFPDVKGFDLSSFSDAVLGEAAVLRLLGDLRG